VKIAVIDSGVNAAHPHIVKRPRGFYFDAQAGTFRENLEACDDPVGHGTAVLAAIQATAPAGAEYFVVKLFGAGLRASSLQLVQALEWAMAEEMDIVNLSLGTPNLEFRAAFESVLELAERKRVLVVAPRHAGGLPVLPGSLDQVIGVDVAWDLPRGEHRMKDGCLWTSGYPRPLPGVPQERNLRGISFAVANATGIVARVCEHLPVRTIDSVRETLESTAVLEGAR
jgi:subtilisin family serine protease